uniref:ATP synthase complex subunit 8 n=1 Tax=Agrilinae sp. 2 ACP-2013 TaxID=1434405 RepID=A0A3G4RY89_9COLE|nr:ATP synthase F0 subunit 8 [Agrilinae sp. 2 ACP-2013]
MPQMAPMSWMILFFTFSLTFTVFMNLNYYSLIYNNLELKKKIKNIKSYNWKW